MKIDASLNILGVLLDPATVVTIAWEQVVAAETMLGAKWFGRHAATDEAGPTASIAKTG